MATMLQELDELVKEIKQRRRHLLDTKTGKIITQRKLAEAAGIRQSMMAKIENGNAKPSYELLKRILDQLSVMESRGGKRARQLMHKGIVGIDAYESLEKASEMMIGRDISQLAVSEGKQMVGGILGRAVL